MSAYWSDADPYCWPEAAVLRNRLGIRDPAELERAERVLVRARSQSGLPDGLTRADYCALHRHLFGDLYEWAGTFRTVRLAKARSVFCFPEFIEPNINQLFAELARKIQRGVPEPDAAADLGAWLLHGLNSIHAFRDGNGRTQALFAMMALLRTGWLIDYATLEPDRFLAAMIAAFQTNDHAPIREVLRITIRPASSQTR